MEAWLESLRSPWASILRRLVGTAVVVDIAIAAAARLPLAPVRPAWFKTASEVNGDFQREEIGWPELLIRCAHSRFAAYGISEDRVHLGIL